MSVTRPTLLWKPNFLSRRQALPAADDLGPRPYASRTAALAAIDAARSAEGAHDTVYLVTPQAEGWQVVRYQEARWGHADAGELQLEQAEGLHPQSFLVDARGRVAQLSQVAGTSGFHVVARDSFEASAVAAMGARVLPMVPATPQVNHGRNVEWRPTFAFRPGRDIEQLSDVMQWVHTQLPAGTRIKAGGSRHSWSAAAATDSVYIHPEGMSFIELAKTQPVESLKASLPESTRAQLVRVGAGTTIRTINAELWQRGLAMPVLGGFDGQTIAGVLPTGTHGSVLSHGPLAEVVRSVDLVTPDGSKVRLEPHDGPTDVVAFAASHPGWRLIQDDSTFDAGLINVGTFGVVHSYLLETRPRFYLNEVRTRSSGAEAERILAGGNIYNLMQNTTHPPQATARTFAGHTAAAFHLELLWNPASDHLLVTSRNELPADEAAALSAHEPAEFTRPTRDLIRILKADSRYSRPQVGVALADVFGGPVSALNQFVGDVAPGLISPMVDAAIDGLADAQYTQRSYNVFNIGDGANHLPSQSATLSIPLEGDQYLRAMQIIRDVARDQRDHFGRQQTGPVSMRFVKASRAALGDPVDVCKFEFIFSGNGPEDQTLAKQMMEAYDSALVKAFGPTVRYHWGQIAPAAAQTPERLRQAYPRFDAFRAVQQQFDPSGVMSNDWQRAMFGR